MSVNGTTLAKVRRLAREVDQLAADVEREMVDSGARMHARNPELFAKGFVPHTPYPSPTTGELRRRSMDLTRALAEMRR